MKNSHWEDHFTEEWQKGQFRSKIATGIFVVLFGILTLLGRLDFAIPNWLVSWPMFLIAFGLVVLIKHNFKKLSGYVIMAVGGVFILKKFQPDWINTDLIFPVLIIVIGISVMVKAISRSQKKKHRPFNKINTDQGNSEDYFESNTVFGGVEKTIMTKNFKGAQINSVFGGNEINLMKADFDGEVTIEANAVFGGITLIIPSNWKLISNLNTVAGSIEDKRPNFGQVEDENKRLILNGSCVFGGIEIRTNA